VSLVSGVAFTTTSGTRGERSILVREAHVLDEVRPFAATVARRDHAQPETVRAPCHFRADAAEAYHKQRLPFELDELLLAALAKAARPRAARLLDAVLRQRTSERERERDRMLGHVRPLDTLQIRDEDAALRDCGDRRAAIGTGVEELDELQALAARDDLGRAQADQHVGAFDGFFHCRVISQARHADDGGFGRDAAEHVGDRDISHDDARRRRPAGTLADRRRRFAKLEPLDEGLAGAAELIAVDGGLRRGRCRRCERDREHGRSDLEDASGEARRHLCAILHGRPARKVAAPRGVRQRRRAALWLHAGYLCSIGATRA
jgi:hypothetical protein